HRPRWIDPESAGCQRTPAADNRRGGSREAMALPAHAVERTARRSHHPDRRQLFINELSAREVMYPNLHGTVRPAIRPGAPRAQRIRIERVDPRSAGP